MTRSLGVREAAPRLRLEFPFAAPRGALLTVVADRERVSATGTRIHTVLEEASVLSARVRGHDFEDWVLTSDGRPVTLRGIATDAAVAVVRHRDGRIVETSRIGGTTLRVTGAASAHALVGVGHARE